MLNRLMLNRTPMIQGGYQVSFTVQASMISLQPSATLLVEPDTVRVTGDRCRVDRRGRG